jgi:hypothetical protein
MDSWARYGVGTAVALALLSPAIFLAGGIVALAVVLGLVAVVVLAATFAPALPKLNELPRIGAPQVSVQITLPECAGLTVLRVGSIDDSVLRVGFLNEGPVRVEGVTVNVLVDEAVEITASDHDGNPEQRGSAMPPTVENGRMMNFWTEREGPLPVRATMLHYLLKFPDPEAVGEQFLVRVRYSADGLYGRGDRIRDEFVSVIDPRELGGEGQRGPLGHEPTGELGEDREVAVQPDALDSTDSEGK